MLKNIVHSKIYFDKCISLRKWKTYFIFFFALLGFILSFFQPFGLSPDYEQYDNFFELARSQGLDALSLSRFEPGFTIFSLIIIWFFSSNLIVYSFIVAASLLLKGWIIKAQGVPPRIFVIIVTFYFFRYFSLHELTQLRVACAASLVMVGAIFFWEGSLRRGLFFFTAASLFQISVLAIIPVFFLNVTNRIKVIFFALGVFVLSFLYVNFLSNFLSFFITSLDAYQVHGFSFDKVNPFAFQLIIDWIMLIISLILWSKLTPFMKKIILIELIGMCIFYGSINFGVVAHRFRELYSIFWIFFIADGLRLKETKLICSGFVVICIIFYAYVFFISGKFFY